MLGIPLVRSKLHIGAMRDFPCVANRGQSSGATIRIVAYLRQASRTSLIATGLAELPDETHGWMLLPVEDGRRTAGRQL